MIPIVLVLIPIAFVSFCFTLAFMRTGRSSIGFRLFLLALLGIALLVSIVISDLLQMDPYDLASYAFTGLVAGALLGLIVTAIGALGARPELYEGDDAPEIPSLTGEGLPVKLRMDDPVLVRRSESEHRAQFRSTIEQLEAEQPTTPYRAGLGRQAYDLVDGVRRGWIDPESARARVVDLVGRERAGEVYDGLFGDSDERG